LLKQYYLGCLTHTSYLIADVATGTAVVVDPQRDIDQHRADAQAHGWHIRYVFPPYFHTGFLAGHTPEAMSILVYDYAKDPRHPYTVMTGDTGCIGTALVLRELMMEPGGR
jgi:hypothetical protein